MCYIFTYVLNALCLYVNKKTNLPKSTAVRLMFQKIRFLYLFTCFRVNPYLVRCPAYLFSENFRLRPKSLVVVG